MSQPTNPSETRYRKLRSTGAMVLYRKCAVCGKEWAPFGIADRWYCAPCRPAEWFVIGRRIENVAVQENL